MGLERAVNFLIPPGVHSSRYEVVFEFDERLWINADLGSHLDRRLFLHGYYKHTEYLIQGILKEGGVAMDCGANIGMYTLRMAKSVGGGGKVISIEPHDLVRKRLETNIALNGFRDRVTVVPCAISGSRGRTIFHYPPASHINQGNASFYRKDDGWQEKEVEVDTIDGIASELYLSRLDVIRCDVQGEELNALKGAEHSIRLWAPIICVRYNKKVASAANMNIEELVEYLHGLGYSAFINEKDTFTRLHGGMAMSDAELLFIHASNQQ